MTPGTPWPSRSAKPAPQWTFIALMGAFAVLGFAAIAAEVLAHQASGLDGAVQRWVLSHQWPVLHNAFVAITIVGGINATRVLAVAGAAYLWYRRRRVVAVGMLLAPVAAYALYEGVKRFVERQRPAGIGGSVDTSYSFPSGHATASAAICGTLAYLFWRERLMSRRNAAWFAALVPLLIGCSRVYLNVHWATDVLGGWCAGLFIAALGASLYNTIAMRDTQHPPQLSRMTSTTHHVE